jgi:hypothetical protein
LHVPFIRFRPAWAFVSAGVVALVSALTVVAPPPAGADTLSPVTVTPTADRHFGDGHAAANAAVQTSALAVAAAGATLVFDPAARELRRVDPATGISDKLAGSGAAAPSGSRCTFDTTDAATVGYLTKLTGLWTDNAGDVFGWPGYDSVCGYANVYRLDPQDGHWHLAVRQAGSSIGGYQGVAVDKAGNVYVSDTVNSVIRKFAPGSDPASGGAVVASNTGNPTLMAADDDGDLFIAGYNGSTIREVDTDTGAIQTVAGGGSSSLSVQALTVGSDGTVFFTNYSAGIGAVRAFVVGGAIRTVVGPASPNSDGNPALCPGNQIAAKDSSVLVSCGSTVRSWPADGSAANEPGTRVIGVDNTTGVQVSPDSVRLDDAFVPLINAIAQAPDGTIALATNTAIRSLTGLTASDTLGTISGRSATQIAYGADNTLYAVVGRGSAANPYEILAISNGATHVVVGGGDAALADGATGTSVSLPQVRSMAVDRERNVVYFDVADDGHVWSLDRATGVVTAVVGSLAPSALAVDQRSHAVYVATGSPGTSLDRIDTDGSLHVLGNDQTNAAYYALAVGPDGTVYANEGPAPIVALHPSGATASDFPGLSGPVTVLDDGRLLGLPARDPSMPTSAGGLLATAVPPGDSFPGTAATLTASPASGGVTFTVAPPPVSGAVVTVTGSQLPAAPPYLGGSPALAQFVTDGTTSPRTFTVTHLGPNGTSGPGFANDQTYRIAAYTTMTNGAVTVTSAPATAIVTPGADPDAPQPPQLAVTTASSEIDWTLTMPTDPDLQVVHLRWSKTATPPSSPTDGDGIDYKAGAYQPGEKIRGYQFAPRMQNYAFAAWAEDTSGNLSTPVVALRPVAHETTGSPVSDIGYQAQGDGTTTVFWTMGGYVNDVRYAAGTTAPATPLAGKSAGQMDSIWGTGANLPAASGHHVAVSIFRYTDDPDNTFQRVSFVVTGGARSDVIAISAPKTVTQGTAPVVTGTFVRHGPFATTPIADQLVSLYMRPTGAASWTGVASASTSATGKVTFRPPAQRVSTAYQLRAPTTDPKQIVATRTVAVSSTLTGTLSSTKVRAGHAVAVRGHVRPAAHGAVTLQRHVHHHWRTLVKGKTTSSGSYRLHWTPTKTGDYRLRVAFAGTSKFAGSKSHTLRLRVR